MSSFLKYKEGDIYDPLGKKITLFIQSTDLYIVFIDEDGYVQWEFNGKDPKDFEKVLKLVGEMEDLPNKHLSEDQKKYLSSQLGESIARALGQGESEIALESLNSTKEFLEETCKQNVKIWLLSSSLITLAITLLCGLGFYYIRLNLFPKISTDNLFDVIQYSLCGGIGAFISIFLRTNHLTANFYSTKLSIRFEGFVRVIYGIFGASLVVLGIRANLVLGILNDFKSNPFFFFFVGVLAGASERIIPFIIHNAETKFMQKKEKIMRVQ
jgi:hypothetical protein